VPWHRGATGLYSVDVDTMAVDHIVDGKCVIYGWSKAASRDRFAAAVTSPEIILRHLVPLIKR
jgi:hypothetical protein